MWMGLGH
jgi:hypothetical protein